MFFRLITSVSVIVFLASVAGYGQDADEKKSRTIWGNDKIIDGALNEWSSLGGPGGHGTVDNEYYFYDTGGDTWFDPQGFFDDEPLSNLVIVDHPDFNPPAPQPIMSGFNLWGGYVCYEPYHDDIAIIVGLDLPLSSNTDISADWLHPYNGLLPGMNTFLPIAFDCDGNGFTDTVNSEDYYGGEENGFNFIKAGGLVFDNRDRENYIVTLYLGDDDFPTFRSNTPGGTDGLIIQVELTSEFGTIYPAEANIPGSQTKSGLDLDLVATYGASVLEVYGEQEGEPDTGSTPPIVDIEVKISQLKTIIEDSTYIDWSKVDIGQISVHDLNKIYTSIKSGSLDDKSDEHLVQGGYVFPNISLELTVDKTVSCTDTAPWFKSQDSFRGEWVYYRILIENTSIIDADHVYVEDTLEKVDQAYTDLDWVKGPEFDINQPMQDIGPLNGGGQIEIIFRVFTNENYAVKANDKDIKNTIEVWGDGPDLGPDPDPDVNDKDGPIPINILIGEIDVDKLVQVVDDNGTGDTYGPSDAVILPEDLVYPIIITWSCSFTNISESPIVPVDCLGNDDFLKSLPSLGLTHAPSGALPPWKLGVAPNWEMLKNVPYTFDVTLKVENRQEAEILDQNDITGIKDNIITNEAYFTDESGNRIYEFVHANVCGVEKLSGDDRAHIYLDTPEEVPTLSEWGIILMACVLGGLILLRMRR